tara:strand:+ start:140 stop:676 length:537 start_codon:yes stop_codon:yes gene_type:complete
MKPTTSEWITVKESAVHNKGVFAAKDIPKGTKIIEYVGERITKTESTIRADKVIDDSLRDKTKGAVYLFEINKKYDIDGNVDYNTARFINHSCDPNCEVDFEGERIFIFSIKDIKKGEELNYDYGYDIDNYEDHRCKCGAKNCIGYIVSKEDWPKLKRKVGKKKAKEKKRALKTKQAV